VAYSDKTEIRGNKMYKNPRQSNSELAPEESVRPKRRPSRFSNNKVDPEQQLAGLGRRPKARPEPQEETVQDSIGSILAALQDSDSEMTASFTTEEQTRPVSRGDALGTEVGYRLMGDLKESYGLTDEQAAGLVGNLAHETGDFKFMQELEPVVKGSRGGYGFAQWTGPRRKNFEAWAEENNMDISSYEANLGFLKHEIDETSEGRFMDSLREASTADEAAKVVSKKYLRPGKPNLDSRIARAYSYLEKQ